MEKDLSPEERLLQLIKGKSKKNKPEDSLSLNMDNQRQMKVNPSEIKPQTESPPVSKEQKSQKEAEPKPIRISRQTNHSLLFIILTIVIAIAVVLIVLLITSERKDYELDALERVIKDISISEDIDEPIEEPEESESAKKVDESKDPADSFADYEKLFSTKAVFAPAKGPEKTSVRAAGPQLKEIVSDFRLVGILPGDEPQVIIEEKKSGQTFFLRKGEDIQGIEIREVLTGRVVLGRGDETITLSL
ncbi:MAG: hypothetical protein ABIB11_05205 [Candidatus Omnitrophota bacterium]